MRFSWRICHQKKSRTGTNTPTTTHHTTNERKENSQQASDPPSLDPIYIRRQCEILANNFGFLFEFSASWAECSIHFHQKEEEEEDKSCCIKEERAHCINFGSCYNLSTMKLHIGKEFHSLFYSFSSLHTHCHLLSLLFCRNNLWSGKMGIGRVSKHILSQGIGKGKKCGTHRNGTAITQYITYVPPLYNLKNSDITRITDRSRSSDLYRSKSGGALIYVSYSKRERLSTSYVVATRVEIVAPFFMLPFWCSWWKLERITYPKTPALILFMLFFIKKLSLV